jgi:hypothetical protein
MPLQAGRQAGREGGRHSLVRTGEAFFSTFPIGFLSCLLKPRTSFIRVLLVNKELGSGNNENLYLRGRGPWYLLAIPHGAY